MLLERITGTEIKTPVEISLADGVTTVTANSSTEVTVTYNGEPVTPKTLTVQPADAGATVDDVQIYTADATGAKYLNIGADVPGNSVFVLTATYDAVPEDGGETVTFTATKAITVLAISGEIGSELD